MPFDSFVLFGLVNARQVHHVHQGCRPRLIGPLPSVSPDQSRMPGQHRYEVPVATPRAMIVQNLEPPPVQRIEEVKEEDVIPLIEIG